MTRRSAAVGMAATLAGAGLPLLAVFVLRGAWGALGSCALFLLAALLGVVLPARGLRLGLACLLTGLSALAVVERATSASVWTTNGRSMIFSTPANPLQGVLDAARGVWRAESGERSWTLRDARGATPAAEVGVQLDVTRRSGAVGGAWGASQADVALSADRGPGPTAVATVRFPPQGDPYLWQRFVADEPLAGRSFRASVDVRAVGPAPTLAPRSTRGLWLREREPSGRWAFQRIDPVPEWRTVRLDWTVPADSGALALELGINDLDGWSLELRAPRLLELLDDGATRELAPLLPNGVWATLAFTPSEGPRGGPAAGPPGGPFAGPPAARVGPAVALEAAGLPYALALPLPPQRLDGRLTLTLRTQAGLVVQTRDLRLRLPEGVSATPVATVKRAQLWFGHPNLLGHTLAALLIAYLAWHAAGPRAGWRPARFAATSTIGLVALLGIWTSNSQAALAAALAGGSLLLLVRVLPRRGRALWLPPLAGVSVLVLLSSREPFGNLDPRAYAWRAAFDALRRFPWSGTPDFAAFAAAAAPAGAAPVAHAHAVWLQAGALFGLPGLAAALWFTAYLTLRLWRRAGAACLVTLVPFALLQLLDFTLPFSWVLVPFGVALASTWSSVTHGRRSKAPMIPQPPV